MRRASWLIFAVPIALMYAVHVATRHAPGVHPVATAGMVRGRPVQHPSQRDSTRLWPERGVVLAGDAARQLVHQCSRPAPDAAAVEGTWMPSTGQVLRVDSQLSVRLRRELSGERDLPVALFHRQYAGLKVHGRDIIYVNGFAISPHDSTAGWSARWRTEPIVVCDGGKAFFGAAFDLERDSLMLLGFNGSG
jgi:hypothetical protein